MVAGADSAYYSGAFVAACRRAGARFSVTTPVDQKIHRTVTEIPEDVWTPIRYPRAVWDETNHAWISAAEIAEVGYTAFASGRHATHGRWRAVCATRSRIWSDSAPQPGQQATVPGALTTCIVGEPSASHSTSSTSKPPSPSNLASEQPIPSTTTHRSPGDHFLR